MKRPTPELAQQRLDLLRGAACYAELATLAGTWSAATIESTLDDRSVGSREISSKDDRTNKYVRYLKGAVPNEKTIVSVLAKYPESNLRLWKAHPIGLLLTNGSLDSNAVIDLLELVPHGPERQLLWDESAETLASLGRRREYPIDEETIGDLSDIGTTNAFLALLGRRRLHNLIGQFELDDFYEVAMMDCFAKVVGSDPHLRITQHILVPAFSDYLQWPPGCGDEYVSGFDFKSMESKRYWKGVNRKITKLQKAAVAAGILMPPGNHVERMKDPAAR